MNEIPATFAPKNDEVEPDIVPCKRIRNKMYYVLGRSAVDLRTSSPTSQYWCSLTATAIGPDDVCCSPEICSPSRGCYEAEE
jgi:hypothetical protein